MDILGQILKVKATGRAITFSVTQGLVLGGSGLYEVIQDSIYLYIPLLTMNLMSREYASGSDKLLYSSPVSSMEIVMGKFASMLVCCLVFTGLLALPAVAAVIMVPNADIPLILSCLLSMFLLIMTYCSVGLFMSSLTSYQVVSAVSTLTLLAFFNYIGELGQESPMLREITYWLSLKGRASNMVSGLICSDDVIYFFAVTAFFLALTVLRLESFRTHRKAGASILRYGAAVAALVLVGYISSRPALMGFYDATQNKNQTLSDGSQEVMKKLDGGLEITSYVNVLSPDFESFVPAKQMEDLNRFRMYTRFKPEMKMKYVYYYSPITDTAVLNRYPGLSQEEIAVRLAALKGYKHAKLVSAESLMDRIDLREEEYGFVRVIRRQSGEESRLRIYDDMFRHPKEPEISAAMKKLIVEPVKVATIKGHGERSIKRKGDRDYSLFASSRTQRNAMINQGFDLMELDLATQDMPQDINIMFIADPIESFSDTEMAKLDAFIEKGGNFMVTTENARRPGISAILDRFGVKVANVYDQDRIVAARGTAQSAAKMKGFYKSMQSNARAAVVMPGPASLQIADTSVFKCCPLLVDSLCAQGPQLLAVAMYRDIPDRKQQRIIIVGDADCYSNSFLQIAGQQGYTDQNFTMLPNSFRWLCHGEFPVSAARNPFKDMDIRLSPTDRQTIEHIFVYLIPALIAAAGVITLARRRRR